MYPVALEEAINGVDPKTERKLALKLKLDSQIQDVNNFQDLEQLLLNNNHARVNDDDNDGKSEYSFVRKSTFVFSTNYSH